MALDERSGRVAAPQQLTKRDQRRYQFPRMGSQRALCHLWLGRHVFSSITSGAWPPTAAGTPERMEVAGLGAFAPATVFSRDRLAFARTSGDVDLYRFVAGRPPDVVAASTFPEMEAELSPDGHRLAFTSAHSADRLQIWVSAADGSAPQQLTRGVPALGHRAGHRTVARSPLIHSMMTRTITSGSWTLMVATDDK